MRALVRLTVRKDLHLTGPEFLAAADPHAEPRDGPRYATDGIGPDLMDGGARRAAPHDRVARSRARPRADAGVSAGSVAVDLRISEIVDVPNFVVTAHCPLGIFD